MPLYVDMGVSFRFPMVYGASSAGDQVNFLPIFGAVVRRLKCGKKSGGPDAPELKSYFLNFAVSSFCKKVGNFQGISSVVIIVLYETYRDMSQLICKYCFFFQQPRG